MFNMYPFFGPSVSNLDHFLYVYEQSCSELVRLILDDQILESVDSPLLCQACLLPTVVL